MYEDILQLSILIINIRSLLFLLEGGGVARSPLGRKGGMGWLLNCCPCFYAVTAVVAVAIIKHFHCSGYGYLLERSALVKCGTR